MVYCLNGGSQIMASASIVINSMLCYWIEMPVKECFEVSLLSLGCYHKFLSDACTLNRKYKKMKIKDSMIKFSTFLEEKKQE